MTVFHEVIPTQLGAGDPFLRRFQLTVEQDQVLDVHGVDLASAVVIRVLGIARSSTTTTPSSRRAARPPRPRPPLGADIGGLVLAPDQYLEALVELRDLVDAAAAASYPAPSPPSSLSTHNSKRRSAGLLVERVEAWCVVEVLVALIKLHTITLYCRYRTFDLN